MNKIFVNIVRGYCAITSLSLAHKNRQEMRYKLNDLYFKIKFMIKFNSTKKHFLLLDT